MLKTVRPEDDKAARVYSDHFDVFAQEILARGICLRFKACGSSMHPFIQDGDTIIIEPKTTSELNIGDVIFYRRPQGSYIAHRLIKKNGSASFITKGDNLCSFDNPVPIAQTLGRVIAVERNGRCYRLDSRLNMILSRTWTKLSPKSRWLYPILKPWWRIYRRIIATSSKVS